MFQFRYLISRVTGPLDGPLDVKKMSELDRDIIIEWILNTQI